MKVLRPHDDALPLRPHPGQYGLLSVVATVFDDRGAREVQQLLQAHGLKNTTAPELTQRKAIWARHRHVLHILVFPEDAQRAYETLSRYAR